MSSNAVAAIAVILVSGFAGCAATAKSAEPVAAVVTEVSPAPARFVSATAPAVIAPAPTRTVTIAPDGRAIYR